MKYQLNNQRFDRASLLMTGLTVLSMTLGLSQSVLAQTSTWTGGGTTINWSDSGNWGGTPVVNGNVTFSGTTQRTNNNDVTGLTVTNLTFTTTGWNISGNPVTVANYLSNNVAGTSVWGLNTTLISGSSAGNVYESSASDILNITGALSGSGGIGTVAGSGGQGSIYLSNTNNSFTGRVGPSSGKVFFYSLAPSGQNSSLGAGSGTIVIGASDTSYAASLIYLGTNNGTTDRGLAFANDTVDSPTFTNNSPNNSSLSFGGSVTFTVGTANDLFTTILAGTSTGTNTFNGTVGPPTSSETEWGGPLSIYGPGTWVFNGAINLDGALNVSTNSHVALGFTTSLADSVPLFSAINIGSGGTLDVSAYDDNSSIFTLGYISGFPQTLTAGRAKGSGTDINGSLSLAGTAAATLNVAGTGVAGTLNINGNFVPGNGSIVYDLDNTNTAGAGSNDLIAVSGNLDLSQGTATINVNPLHGPAAIETNVYYTLMTYSGTLTGDASDLSVPAPSYAYLPGVVDTSIPQVIRVIFYPSGAPPTTLAWQGGISDNWDVNTTANWLNGTTATDFSSGDNALFNDTSSQTTVNLVGSISAFTVTVSNNVDSYVFSGGSLASDNILKQGTGSLTLSSANTYSDGTVISAGTILLNNASGLGTGSVTLGDTNTGANTPNLTIGAGLVVANPIIISSNSDGGAFIASSSGAATLNSPIVMQTGFTFTNDATTENNFLIQGGITGTGNVTVIGGGGVKLQTGACVFNGNLNILPGTSGLTLCNLNAALSTNTSINVAAGAQLGIVNSPAFNALTGAGEVVGGPGAAYVTDVVLGSGNGSGTFSGIITTNAGGYAPGVIKNGTGTEIFTGNFTGASSANAVTNGNTTINAGTLAINNTDGTGLNPVGVVVNVGGTLAGSGSINQSSNGVAVYGTLSVGNATDTTGSSFTIIGTGTNGALNIYSNGVLVVNLFSGAGAGDNTGNAAAADVLKAQTEVILTNAVLSIGNPNGLTAWAVGDKWQIANWGSTVTGTFGSLNAPTLPAGMAWDTSELYSSGVIDIVAASNPTQPASITGVTVSDGNLVFTGTNLNGGANFHYVVLATTNLALPLANWTVLSTNAFNADGTFSFTNAINPSQPALFFNTKAVQ